ncbi:uncharacterized protein LOC124174117 [Ischnura elegans]|uniref:uncharacterized protein LOC124174117 n=1 Tax=Ischnura elegans TaxID=197161 RepID=UPI001ED8BFA5|nr:uncharacterized protein LOC124174117 [Ischnura elegans]
MLFSPCIEIPRKKYSSSEHRIGHIKNALNSSGSLRQRKSGVNTSLQQKRRTNRMEKRALLAFCLVVVLLAGAGTAEFPDGQVDLGRPASDGDDSGSLSFARRRFRRLTYEQMRAAAEAITLPTLPPTPYTGQVGRAI